MLSVVIVNWNTEAPLRNCLASLRRFPPSGPNETIVVDNASTDGSAEMVRREFPEVRLIESPRNVGYAAGNNLGMAAAAGDLILTLNPDTEIREGALDRAIAALETRPRLGCVAVRLVGPDGATQRSVRGFPTFLGILGDVTGLARRFPQGALGAYRLPAFDYDLEQEAPQPMGSFLLFRREALAAIGDPRRPFDECFPIFFNEVDLLYRLRRRGWRCLYTPDAALLHLGGESTRQVRGGMIWESHRSLVRYLWKHAGPVGRVGVALAAPLVYAAALVRAKGYHARFRA